MRSVDDDLDGNLPAIGANHGGVKRAHNFIRRGTDAQRVNTRCDSGERYADHDADDGYHDQHFKERNAPLRFPPPGHFDFQLTMSSFMSTPPGWPSAP